MFLRFPSVRKIGDARLANATNINNTTTMSLSANRERTELAEKAGDIAGFNSWTALISLIAQAPSSVAQPLEFVSTPKRIALLRLGWCLQFPTSRPDSLERAPEPCRRSREPRAIRMTRRSRQHRTVRVRR